MNYRLLAEFQALFQGREYRHRSSAQGDRVAVQLYEDLFTLGRSKHFVEAVKAQEKVINIQNRRRGITARRGDGTFGELVPHTQPVTVAGYNVARGPIANVEIGVEAKFVQKAMIKQVDRVMNDLDGQLKQFNKGATNPICAAIVGINHAEYTISYDGLAVWKTDGKKHKHPHQEAASAEARLLAEVKPKFFELIILKYRATNDPPYPFEWVSYADTFQDYGAALVRISREYDIRFGP
jgi:hypothetical protein